MSEAEGGAPPRLDYTVLFQGLRPRSRASLEAALVAAKRGNVGGIIAVRLQDGKPTEVVWSTANMPSLAELFKFE